MSATAPRPPQLSDYYDLSTFLGRYRYTWSFFSPANLRFGARDVAEANATLQNPTAASSQALHDALLVRATCAPSGELLPWFFRACGWALGGTPGIAFILYSAVHHPTSLRHILAGQVLNQTHLAGCTYCNRGGGGDVTAIASIARAYVVSIVTAVPIAFGAAVAAKRWTALRPLGRYAPYPGVAAANAVACLTIRGDDVVSGVPVHVDMPASGTGSEDGGSAARGGADGGVATGDGEGAALGMSQRAGWQAVRDTALTRTVMPMGNFVIVPLVQRLLEGVRGGRRPGLLAQVGLTAAIFSLWLPVSAAACPPVGKLPVEELEPELKEKLPRDATHVRYERGV